VTRAAAASAGLRVLPDTAERAKNCLLATFRRIGFRTSPERSCAAVPKDRSHDPWLTIDKPSFRPSFELSGLDRRYSRSCELQSPEMERVRPQVLSLQQDSSANRLPDGWPPHLAAVHLVHLVAFTLTKPAGDLSRISRLSDSNGMLCRTAEPHRQDGAGLTIRSSPANWISWEQRLEKDSLYYT
jgi:hypothetical protein